MKFIAQWRLRRWMAGSFQSRSFERFDNVPVTSLDADWWPRDRWVDAALECFLLGRALRDRANYPLAVAVTFSLRDRDAPAPPPRDRERLADDLDDAPPAVALFAPDADMLEEIDEWLDPGLFGLRADPGVRCGYRAWSFEEETGAAEPLIRSLVLLSEPKTARPGTS
jgi:hypothetical protein